MSTSVRSMLKYSDYYLGRFLAVRPDLRMDSPSSDWGRLGALLLSCELGRVDKSR